MKTITVHTTWKATDRVEVPDDFEDDGSLNDAWADQVDSSGAYLADWEVSA